MTSYSKPSVWIGDLASYNAGDLIGEWVQLDNYSDVDDLMVRVNEILARGAASDPFSGVNPHEEWFIADYDGFGPLRVDEYSDLGKIMAWAEHIVEDSPRFFAYFEYHGQDYVDGYDAGNVIGPWESMDDIAHEHVDEFILPELPASIRQTVENYFDYEAFARDLMIDGQFIHTIDGVFEIVD